MRANLEIVEHFGLTSGNLGNCRRLPIATGRLLTRLLSPTRDQIGMTWADIAKPIPTAYPLEAEHVVPQLVPFVAIAPTPSLTTFVTSAQCRILGTPDGSGGDRFWD
jgi:hypothetical protein